MHTRPHRPGRRAVVVVTVLASLVAGPAGAIAAPDNTSPDTATPVTALPFVQSIDVAGVPPGITYTECGPADHTVWYLLEPATTMDVLIDTTGSSYDTLLDVQVQDGGDLLCVDDTATSVQARAAFTVREGSAYLVAVGRRVQDDGPGEGPAGVVPTDTDELTLELRIEQTRIQRRGAPTRSTHWWRGGSASAHEVLIDEPDEFRMQGFVIDAGRSDARTHDDVDLTWRHHRIDHDKETVVIEHWDAYGSPGVAAVDQRLDRAVAEGELWLQGRLCVYPLEDDHLGAADLDDDPSETDPCTVLGGNPASVDAVVVGVGPLVRHHDATMQQGFDGRQLTIDQGVTRDGVASLRVRSDLLSYDLVDQPATMVHGHYRSTVWHR